MYYLNDERYSGVEPDTTVWSQKAGQVFWRGVTAGGQHTAENYPGFHRHRFMNVLNGTLKPKAKIPPTSDSPPIPASRYAETAIDAAFTRLECLDPECTFLSDKHSVAEPTPFEEHYKYKFLPDVDGKSFSGRWRAFLLSNSVSLKSTLFREWHDSRLFAWHHFIPMDIRYDDFYALLDYLSLGEFSASLWSGSLWERLVSRWRTDQAAAIASRSTKWAQQVLRKEDIEVYMFRLLLEYARLLDPQRDELGFAI